MKLMETAELLKILETQEDILTPLAESQQKSCESVVCPLCGGPCSAAPHPTTPFVAASPLPNRIAKCVICEALICPDTKMILRHGLFSLITPMS